ASRRANTKETPFRPGRIRGVCGTFVSSWVVCARAWQVKAAFAERAPWAFHVKEIFASEKEGNLAESGNLTAAPFRAQFDNASDSHHFLVCLSADSVPIHMLAGRKHQACAAARTFGTSKAAILPSLD